MIEDKGDYFAPLSLSREGGPRHWWDDRRFLLIVVLLMAVPLLLPAVPPLVDLPGHMGRYRVELDIGHSAALQSFYSFQWQLIGNLGIDLLVVPLAPLLGLELAVKLIVMAIPVLRLFSNNSFSAATEPLLLEPRTHSKP